MGNKASIESAAPMRAVVRESAGMVFHSQAEVKYLPQTPKAGTDEVILSVRAAAINPIDFKVQLRKSACVYARSDSNNT